MCDRVCVVRGALSRVLRASRLLGVTPLRFTPLQDGYSVSVSPLQLLYSYAFATIFFFIGIWAYFLDIQVLPEAMSIQTKFLSFPYWQVDVVTFVSTVVLIYCCTKYRVSNMILHLNNIEKIKINIDENYSLNSKHGKGFKMTILFIVLLTILEVTDYSEYNPTNVKGELCYVINYISLLTIILVEIQIELIHYEVLEMFQMMNTKLRHLLTLDPIEDSFAINNNVRNISYCYVSGCEAVKQINKSNGLLTLHSFFMTAITVIAAGINISLGPPNLTLLHRICFVTSEVSWLLYFIFKIIYFVESCHVVIKEVSDMKINLSRLLYRATPAGRPLSLEMDILFKETLLNAPEFMPLGVFTIDRSLIIAMCSYITTYLVLSLDAKFQ